MKKFAKKPKDLVSRELLNALFEIIESIASAIPYEIDVTLGFLVEKVGTIMGAFACNLRLLDEESNQLVLKASYGLTNAYKEKPVLAVGEGVAGLVFKENRALSVKDIREDPRYIYRHYAEREGVRALLCAPLTVQGIPVGTLSVYLKKLHEFSAEEKEFFAILTNYLSAVVEILQLQRDLHRHYVETMQALVIALEAKDEHTRGHSERVAKYAAATAKERGLPPSRVQLYYDAGILHDLGKLTLDLSILDKPNRLTEEEYELVKEHPVIGERIIRPVKMFEIFLRPTRHHHERVDGLGYPDRLKSEELDLLTRTITVADAYDAMTSRRPYREALSKQEAIEELSRGSELQFDPKIVQLFKKVLEYMGEEKFNESNPKLIKWKKPTSS